MDGAPEGAEAFDWTISTRYYTARTRVLLVAGDSSRPGGASDAVLRDYKCDAVILVLDCNRVSCSSCAALLGALRLTHESLRSSFSAGDVRRPE